MLKFRITSHILLKRTFILTLFQLPLINLIDTNPFHMTEQSILITFFQLELYEGWFPTMISVQMCWLLFFLSCFVFWGTENTASHGLRINHISDVTWKSCFFFSEAESIQINYSYYQFCISNAIFYISNKQLGQKFCFSFIIILLCILVCFSVTMTTEGSSNIFTLSLSFYITLYSFV